MYKVKFKTKVLQTGKTATGFIIPEDIVLSFNKGLRIPVIVTVNNYSYRSTLVKYNGQFMIPFAAENREGAGVKAGDMVELDLELDEGPRTVEVPKDLQDELDKFPELKDIFNKLSYTHRKEYVRWITDAKKDETRIARLKKTIEHLKLKVK